MSGRCFGSSHDCPGSRVFTIAEQHRFDHWDQLLLVSPRSCAASVTLISSIITRTIRFSHSRIRSLTRFVGFFISLPGCKVLSTRCCLNTSADISLFGCSNSESRTINTFSICQNFQTSHIKPFLDRRQHHSGSNPCVVNFSVRAFSVTV